MLLSPATVSTTGQFCDLILAEWRNQSKEADKCSDCILGPIGIGLQSPLEYNSEDAAEFSSLTKECGAKGYEFKTPTPYAATSTRNPSQGTGAPTPASCNGRKYVVKQNDTCQSIAFAQKVSTYALMQDNGIDVYCSGLPEPGRTLCLPKNECKPYILNPGDTCEGLAAAANATVEQILRWNPIFNLYCTNADGWYGYVVCLRYVFYRRLSMACCKGLEGLSNI
jgi:LysM repeat protein